MEEEKVEQWELLPPNTSFLDFGLEDIKDLFSKEIDYIDYFIEQPPQQLNLIKSNDDEKPLQQPIAKKIQVRDDEFDQQIKVEDPEQNEFRENSSVDTDKEDLADERRRRRPIVAGIGELLSIGAAVAAAMVFGFLLGSGRRREFVNKYKDDKVLKQMVRQANRVNQVLVATASGMPPPAMSPATISFGGCFGDMV